jgi:hypothetical protein
MITGDTNQLALTLFARINILTAASYSHPLTGYHMHDACHEALGVGNAVRCPLIDQRI